ncbi:MAG: T9SS type A sorting domain-containing protein [Bacteroidetes bacterium]|nr:T9SS type A sorting domain-containing protein [Bacteroidota bacterium]
MNETNILISSSVNESYQIKIYDIYGNLIYENAMAVNNETKIISINTSNWATGNYVMIANNKKESKILKFAKVN